MANDVFKINNNRPVPAACSYIETNKTGVQSFDSIGNVDLTLITQRASGTTQQLQSISAVNSPGSMFYQPLVGTTWQPVIVGSNITFAGGTLSASTGGGGGGAGGGPTGIALISGGSINNTLIGNTTASTGSFVQLNLSGSGIWSNQGNLQIGSVRKIIELVSFAPTISIATGSGASYFMVPPSMSGANLAFAHAYVITTGSAGTNTTLNVTRNRSGSITQMLTSGINIVGGQNSCDVNNLPTIGAGASGLATYDLLSVNVSGVSTTAPLGLIVTMEVAL